jgi:hypothetical protein
MKFLRRLLIEFGIAGVTGQDWHDCILNPINPSDILNEVLIKLSAKFVTLCCSWIDLLFFAYPHPTLCCSWIDLIFFAYPFYVLEIENLPGAENLILLLYHIPLIRNVILLYHITLIRNVIQNRCDDPKKKPQTFGFEAPLLWRGCEASFIRT